MIATSTRFATVSLFLLIISVEQLIAATIHGSVHDPQGLVAGATVQAFDNSDQLVAETTTNAQGEYSLDIPGEASRMVAVSPNSNDGLVGEGVEQIDLSFDREIRLYLFPQRTISGTVQLPEWLDDVSIWMNWLEPRMYGNLTGVDELGNFEIGGPAGTYALNVTPACEVLPENLYTCFEKDYHASATVDLRNDSISGLVIQEGSQRRSIFGSNPPIASLISIGAPNEGGVATVTGAPGAMDGVSGIVVYNLQTGQINIGASQADGSFNIEMFAPPGAWISVNQDKTGKATFGGYSFAPETLVSAPASGSDPNAFATMQRIEAFEEPPPWEITRVVGARDGGQVWIGGDLANRNWSPGQTINISGSTVIYSQNTPETNINDVQITSSAFLERIFDASGRQEVANPEFVSHLLTPTGFPIERHSGGDRIYLGDLNFSSLLKDGDRSISGTWNASLLVPDQLPTGVYQLSFESSVTGVPTEQKFFDEVYNTHFRNLFPTTGAALIEIGSVSNRKLSWLLAMNDFSDGARGVVAREDEGHIGVSGHISFSPHKFVLPRVDRLTGKPVSYRLEPFVPLSSSTNRNWTTRPTVPFKFPSGSLSVSVKKPDGSTQNLGSSQIQQAFAQEATARSPNAMSPQSNHPTQYLALTTLNSDFLFAFDQYGHHEITMTGSIQDEDGHEYTGGGTYDIWIARNLEIETGVFASTPFEVGDYFSPSVIVQPGVPAEIEITISHYPESDPSQMTQRVISGKANRFGYFHPNEAVPHQWDAPGEYRVDITTSHRDENGVFWMGTTSWASVVQTPDSPVIAHGKRNNNDFDGIREQWTVADSNNIPGTHLTFPYHTGDIAWMRDTPGDPFHTALVPDITLQDTGSELSDIARESSLGLLNPTGLENQISRGEIPLFSNNANGMSASLQPSAEDNLWGYFYSGVARPGVKIREMVSEFDSDNGYWRFDDTYNYQAGNGINGDLPNDFKFQYAGAVVRKADEDYFYYGAYGSLFVALPDDDVTGTRVFPPFQGNGGGPSGGPILTLLGEDIDMFFHPTGVRPGSILELGQVASFAGAIAPTLPAKADITITAPSGAQRQVSGTANVIGYFYRPDSDFVVDETGVWEVDVAVSFEGQTSAGPVQAPFPFGGVLGVGNSGAFRFFVVDPNADPLASSLEASSLVKPAEGVINIPFTPPTDLTGISMDHVITMPGFMLDQGSSNALTFDYDANALHQDFPNLDLYDPEGFTGADTVTMSFMVTGVDGGGNTVRRARQVLLQGEELIAPEQAPTFFINAGVNDAWVHAGADKQGMFLTAFPDLELMFAAWFTFDSVPDGSATAVVGAPDQRWVTALGSYKGTRATLNAELTTGGRFNSSEGSPQQDTSYGTLEIDFSGCSGADVNFNFPSAGESGSFTINRVLNDNVTVCQGIVNGTINPTSQSTAEQAQAMSDAIKGKAESVSQVFAVNSGMNDAWVNAGADKQGMFLTAFPSLKLMFAAWFTFDSVDGNGTATFGANDHRWLTALGSYDGTTASLKLENTTGGGFNATNPKPTQDTDYGTMDIDFSDCNNASVTFNIPSASESGGFTMTRVLPSNVGLCEALSEE